MRLLLIRHGRTESNEKFKYCGQTDVCLSENGISELLYKKDKMNYPSIDGLRVYTSGLKRTEQTLNLLYGDIPHEVLPNFMEMAFGEFEDLSYEELKDNPDFIEWCSGDNFANVCPGGESGYQMADRVMYEFKRLMEKNEDCIVFSHGGPIGALYILLNNEDPKEWYTVQPGNGEGYEFDITDGKIVSCKHIPE